jgi:hypothetical protein
MPPGEPDPARRRRRRPAEAGDPIPGGRPVRFHPLLPRPGVGEIPAGRRI